jgi:superfamily II helicase
VGCEYDKRTQTGTQTLSGSIESMKSCSTCGLSKPLDQFSWKQKDRGSRQSICKPCFREYVKQHYQDNAEKYKASTAVNRPKYKQQVREYVIQYLKTHPCVDCGEADIDVLEFDHIVSIGSGARPLWQATSLRAAQREIDLCEVRCSNCHTRRTRVQMGWRARQ